MCRKSNYNRPNSAKPMTELELGNNTSLFAVISLAKQIGRTYLNSKLSQTDPGD
jgi:hypothetical protein